MSFCVVRMAKFQSSAIGGLQNHDTRARESKTNPDIDKHASEDNYSLLGDSGGLRENITARVRELTAEQGRKVRKDAVVCCGMLVTSDKDFFETLPAERQRAFFQDSFDFLQERYGEKNVVSATVHMDEKTPHLHFYFVPECNGRLSAKDLFALPKRELENLQTDFAREVGAKYGLERGIEGSPAKHISVTRHKADEAEKRVQAAEQKLAELTPKILKAAEVEKLHGKKSLFGDSLKNVSYTEFLSLKETAGAVEQMQQQATASERRADIAERELATTKKQVSEQLQDIGKERKALERDRAIVEKAKAETPSALLQRQNQELKAENKAMKSLLESVRSFIKFNGSAIKSAIERMPNAPERFEIIKNALGLGKNQSRGR